MVRRKRKLRFKNTSSRVPIVIFCFSVVIGGFFLLRIVSTLVEENNGSAVKIIPVENQSLVPTTKLKDKEIDVKGATKNSMNGSSSNIYKTAPRSTAVSECYTIQVASFKNRRRAENLVSELKEEGFSPLYVRTRGEWFEVCVGRFDNRVEGEDTLSKLREDFFDAFTRKLQPPFEQM
jgi:cell division septation protein DedD